jgi:hypothetical protein
MLNSLFNSYNRLCHFILAKPIDILHSPFVFKLYQDAVAIKRNNATNKQLSEHLFQLNCKHATAISQLLTALNAVQIFEMKQVQETWVLIKIGHTATTHALEDLDQYNPQIDAIYLAEAALLNKLPLASLKSLLNSHCPLLVSNPHAHANASKQWVELYEKNEVQIAVDFFDFGLCFFNRKQAKEYFKLRLW